MLIVSDAVPGPPWEMTKMVSKAFSASMVLITAAIVRNGTSIGSVM